MTEVKSKDSINEPLGLLMKLLGIRDNLHIYKHNNMVFIEIMPILKLLDVTQTWFINNAIRDVHYLIKDRLLCANKYGFTKILGQSREKISINLQDYIYDIIYKLETNGTVNIMEENKIRERLFNEVKFYQYMQDYNGSIAEKLKSDLSILQLDYQTLNDEHDKLNDKCKEIESENTKLREIAETLIIKIKSHNEKLLTKKISEKITQITGLDDILYDDTYIEQKKYLENRPVREQNAIKNQKVHILQHINKQFYPNMYWCATSDLTFITGMPLDDYKVFSMDYLAGKNNNSNLIQYIYKYTVDLPPAKAELLTIMLENIAATDAQITNIVDTLIRI